VSRAKTFLTALVLCLLCLYACAAKQPNVGLGRDMSVGLSSAMGQRGGAAAGWDTVTLVMTTEALSDSAGYDHGASRYPPQFYDGVYDKARIDALNVILKQPGIEYKRLGEAQGGADYDVPTFAYADIYNSSAADSLDWNGFRHSAGTSQYITSVTVISGAILDQRLNGVTRKLNLFYVPWESVIPAGSSIVSAYVNMSANGNQYISPTDTLVAIQMNNPNDNMWYKQKAIANAPNMAETCWNRQQTYRWGGTSGYPWNPPLADRTMIYDVGSSGIMDFSSSLSVANPGQNSLSSQVWDLTDCVQSSVNGGVNNGIMLTALERGSKVDLLYQQWDRRDTVSGINRRVPYIVVKYITKHYAPLFPGGKEWAFVFQTDDGVKAFNDTMVSIFTDATDTFPNGRPGKYTAYVSRSTMAAADRWTPADAISWHDQGIEIASHGRQHWFDTTIAINHKVSAGRSDFAATDTVASVSWDSLTTKYNRAWLDSIATANGRPDLTSSRTWDKSVALPGNAWGPWTLVAIARSGWSTMRCGAMGDEGSIANLQPAYTDTARAGVDSRVGRMPRDILLLPTNGAIESIVGEHDNTTITEAQVKYNFRKLVQKVKGQGRGVLPLYVHAFKNSSYNAGEIDPEEMRWILQVVDSEGGAYMTATEYGDWMRSWGTPIDTPAAYGQAAPFNFSAAYKVWIKPDGIDNRWIRGVK
jgi:hypothetical protein